MIISVDGKNTVKQLFTIPAVVANTCRKPSTNNATDSSHISARKVLKRSKLKQYEGQTSIERLRVGFIVSIIALVPLIFVSAFMHQVQTKDTFRVTVTVFGASSPPDCDYGWLVIVERLSYEELKNVEILIDQGTPSNLQTPFYWPHDNRTIDGRAQKVFGLSWHPSNITMVWDGGSEIFLINPTPIQGAP